MSLLFSTDGRIPRHKWWIGMLGLLVYSFAASFVLWQVFGESVILSVTGRIVHFIVNLFGLYVAYCLAVKRFQDRDKSAIYARIPTAFALVMHVSALFHVTGDPWVRNGLDYVFMVVSLIIGLWYLIELGCLRGTVGDNGFGPDPVGAAGLDAALPHGETRP